MILTPLTTIPFWFFVKIAVAILLFMYLVFALIMIRQIKLMTDTLQLGNDGFLKLLAYAHLIFAAIVLISALVIL